MEGETTKERGKQKREKTDAGARQRGTESGRGKWQRRAETQEADGFPSPLLND